MRNKMIGVIDGIWGPFFRVSFDLVIHSLSQDEWSSLLAFRGRGSTCVVCGEMVPVLFLNNYKSLIHVSYASSDFDFFDTDFKIELNHWYSIIAEQKYVNKQVIKLKIKTSIIIFLLILGTFYNYN